MSVNYSKMRIHWLDGLRAIASISVVYFHLNEILPSSTEFSFYRTLAKQGWLGVPVFFFISGYCIKMVADKSSSAFEFWKRRFWRIFPVYYFSLLIVLIVVLIRIITSGQNDVTVLPKTPLAFLATLTLATSPATIVPTINWVYWSLTYEVFFYLLVGLSLFLQQRFQEISIIGISALSCNYLFLDQELFFFLNQWPSFALGYFVYLWLEDKKILLGLLGLGVSMVSLYINFAYLSDKSSFAYISVLGLTFLFVLLTKYRNIQIPILLKKSGLYSYSLYLIHVPIGVYLLARYRSEYVLSHPILHFGVDTLILAVLLILSSLIFNYIEIPFQKYGKTGRLKNS